MALHDLYKNVKISTWIIQQVNKKQRKTKIHPNQRIFKRRSKDARPRMML
jgi:hypothetical protein